MTDSETARSARKAKKRPPKKATPAYLEKAALHYLDRYSASSAHLRRLMMIKVNRSAQAHGTDPQEGAAALEALIARLTALGLLDDARYAQARARSFWRRGTSAQGIRAKLAAKGVPAELIGQALESLTGEAPDPELAAALAYARRRRYGPYGAAGKAAVRDRALAAFARQGFGYEIANRILDAADPAVLELEAFGDPD